jgi:hypothetical protein
MQPGIMASSGGVTSEDMELSDIKASRNTPSNRGVSGFFPAPHTRPGLVMQRSNLRVPTASELAQNNPAIDIRWQNRQVGYADQQPFDQSSNAEKGYPPGFGPRSI